MSVDGVRGPHHDESIENDPLSFFDLVPVTSRLERLRATNRILGMLDAWTEGSLDETGSDKLCEDLVSRAFTGKDIGELKAIAQKKQTTQTQLKRRQQRRQEEMNKQNQRHRHQQWGQIGQVQQGENSSLFRRALLQTIVDAATKQDGEQKPRAIATRDIGFRGRKGNRAGTMKRIQRSRSSGGRRKTTRGGRGGPVPQASAAPTVSSSN